MKVTYPIDALLVQVIDIRFYERCNTNILQSPLYDDMRRCRSVTRSQIKRQTRNKYAVRLLDPVVFCCPSLKKKQAPYILRKLQRRDLLHGLRHRLEVGVSTQQI